MKKFSFTLILSGAGFLNDWFCLESNSPKNVYSDQNEVLSRNIN